MTRFTTISFAILATLAACKGKDKEGDKASADKPAEGAGGAAKLPALKADPDPAAITPADKPPFESVLFQMTDKRNSHGWPKYNAYNLGTKPITFLAISLYAYDSGGKQVAHTDTPMSWNGKLAPGGKSDWEIEVGMGGPDVPGTAASYEACFDSMKFDGDDKFTEDNARCPAQKPKAK